MRVLNLIWGFSLGGVGKCYLIYANVPRINSSLEIKSVCINLQNVMVDLDPLKEIDATIINIKNRSDFFWLPELKKLIEEYRPDVIFTHGFNGPVVALAIRWRYGIKLPLLCSYHGEYHPPTFKRRLFAPIFNAVVLFIYRKYATAILCVTENNILFLKKKGIQTDKITIVRNGIPDIPDIIYGLTKSPFQDREIIIGFCGRIDPIKGLEYLLFAVKKLSFYYKNFGLIIIGTGPLKNTLESRIRSLDLEPYVHFTGYQSNIPQWLSIMDIYVQPSLFENHSISIIEAMRSGKAIIATSVGGNTESLVHNKEGILIEARSSEKIEEAIWFFIKNPSIRDQFGKAARNRYVKEFTEETMMKNVANWLLKFDRFYKPKNN